MDTVVSTSLTTVVVTILGAIGVTAVSVSLLFKTMGTGYGGIIAAQQTEITQLRGVIETERLECRQTIKRLAERVGELETAERKRQYRENGG